jgi:integrase
VTDDIFTMADDHKLDDADLRLIARYWLKRLKLWDKIESLRPGQLRSYELPDVRNPFLNPDARRWRPNVRGAHPKVVEDNKEAALNVLLRNTLVEAGYGNSDEMVAQVLEGIQVAAEGLVDELKDKVFQSQPSMNQSITKVHEGIQAAAENLVNDLKGKALQLHPSAISTAPAISTFFDTYAAEMMRGKKWTQHTKAQNINSLQLMVRIVGDNPAGSITRSEAKRLREALERVPKNYGKSPSHFAKPIEEVLKEGPGEGTLSISTLERHWTTISAFYRWLGRQDGVPSIDTNRVLEGFIWTPLAPKKQNRVPWDMERLKRLFLSPIWTGYKPKSGKEYWRWEPGNQVTHDHYFWLPLLGIFTGARLEELSQLRCEDIADDDGVDTIRITNEHPEQRLKNDASRRKVPIHSSLTKFGFLDYVRSIESGWLFPEMITGGRDDKRSHYYSKRFTQYRREIEVYAPLVDFHSFRHTAITELIRAKKADRAVISHIVGHSTAELQDLAKAVGMTWDAPPLPAQQTMEYFGGFTPEALKETLEELHYPKLDLSHLMV